MVLVIFDINRQRQDFSLLSLSLVVVLYVSVFGFPFSCPVPLPCSIIGLMVVISHRKVTWSMAMSTEDYPSLSRR